MTDPSTPDLPDDATEVRRLRLAVEQLTAERGELAQSTQGLTAAIGQLRGEVGEANRRADAAAVRVEEVDTDAQTRLDDESAALRGQIRTRVIIAASAIVVVVVVLLVSWAQATRTQHRFDRVYTGLIEACTKSQATNAGLRVKNTKLRDDTHALVVAAEGLDAPAAVLGPIVSYLKAEETAYTEYLKSLPPPTDCRARYGSR
ncbi:hypothetical protein [Frankia sp. AgB32]|uniref:hypothetical protein n=1 Tax=Frankia sp. AgB32 TaxID=631119 RepID=UPI00200F0C1D|nr:hypothetical protein [Frankia sp. AgB32]MCK9896985.1 hypothetical protein [Frankia sp. AgB32]